MPVNEITVDSTGFHQRSTGFESTQLDQDFYMATKELWAQCTPHEWYLLGRIGSELKANNALWHCRPALKLSSGNRKAIKGLLTKKVLVKTETTDIYLINPIYIRRGHFAVVLHTTAKVLMEEPKVGLEHIRDLRAVKELNLTADKQLLLNTNQ